MMANGGLENQVALGDFISLQNVLSPIPKLRSKGTLLCLSEET